MGGGPGPPLSTPVAAAVLFGGGCDRITVTVADNSVDLQSDISRCHNIISQRCQLKV